MRSMIVLCVTLAASTATGSTQTGVVYRFQSGSTAGTVWVAGNNARLELEPTEGSATGVRRVKISKDGGKQLLVLNNDHSYYDSVAYHARASRAVPSLGTLNVREPFIVAAVKKVRIDVASLAERAPGGNTDSCRRVSLTLSYDLQLRLKTATVPFPGRVEGHGEFCLADSLPNVRLPFGHGLELTSGIQEVDAVLADRLASLKGVPVKRTLTVTRQMEGGESVSETYTLVLSDFREAEIPEDRFDVPVDYRYQEPVIVGPKRQVP